MMMSRGDSMQEIDKCIESYRRLKNLKLVGAEVGVPWQTVYVMLRAANEPVTGDKWRYGSDKDRLSAMAEAEFARLVPIAVNQNKLKFQARVDFMVGGFKVDVKSSRVNKGMRDRAGTRWAFSIKKQEFCADFMACFGYAENSYRIFLIPGEMLRHYQSISIGKTNKSKWLDYEIAPSDIAKFFDDLCRMAAA